jgi:hypothetical protein
MKRYLLLVLFCLAVLSCDQDTNFYVTPDVSTFEFGPDGGEFDDVIFTNGSWTCEVSDDAVTVTPTSGDYTATVHVVVPPNNERYTKSIRIKFISTYGDLSRNSNVVVTQDCYPFIFCEDEDVKTIGPEGGKVRFTVNSNQPWVLIEPDSIESLAGFSAEPLSGGPNSTTVTLNVPTNDTGEERWLDVLLYLESDPEVYLILTVIQSI